MDRIADCFAHTYGQARAKFLAAVVKGGARLLSSHTLRFSQGASDTERCGASRTAEETAPSHHRCCLIPLSRWAGKSIDFSGRGDERSCAFSFEPALRGSAMRDAAQREPTGSPRREESRALLVASVAAAPAPDAFDAAAQIFDVVEQRPTGFRIEGGRGHQPRDLRLDGGVEVRVAGGVVVVEIEPPAAEQQREIAELRVQVVDAADSAQVQAHRTRRLQSSVRTMPNAWPTRWAA